MVEKTGGLALRLGSVKSSQDRRPWQQGTIEIPPAGLRDTVTRIAWMADTDVRRILQYRSRHALTRTVALWRLEQPVRWAELLVACGIVLNAERAA